MSRPTVMLTDGTPVPEDGSHKEIDPATGMQRGYVVLSADERTKGFVRPVRRSYVHVGAPRPRFPLRDLTPEEWELYRDEGFVKYEAYPESESTAVGRWWTQADLDRVEAGCGAVTSMSPALAETYARDPRFYGATYCICCRTHLPVGAEGEFVWDNTTIRVGT